MSFVSDDFSVLYVASNSQLALPLLFKVSAVWGAHEGSLLLWVLILSTWTTLVCLFSKNLPDIFSSRVIGVLGFLNFGFILFTLFTSNPFERIFPSPLDGNDLNPLLQGFRFLALGSFTICYLPRPTLLTCFFQNYPLVLLGLVA